MGNFSFHKGLGFRVWGFSGTTLDPAKYESPEARTSQQIVRVTLGGRSKALGNCSRVTAASGTPPTEPYISRDMQHTLVIYSPLTTHNPTAKAPLSVTSSHVRTPSPLCPRRSLYPNP